MSDKLARLQQALAQWQLDAVLLTRRDNIAWLTDGASYYVVERAETGVASLLIGRDSVLLLAPDNELPRILAEEPLPFSCATRHYPWYQSLSSVLPAGHIGSDTPMAGLSDIQPQMITLRQGLSAPEQQRFRTLGQETAQIVETVARQLRVGVSEWQVEADIAAGCLARGIRPMCTLVAADERIAAFKHPVPTRKTLQRMMLITLGAERHGLHVSLTRLVHLGEPDSALRQRIVTLAEIHADMLYATQAQRSWSAVFADITQAYQRHGHAEAWRDHHQGGPAGYGCRDWIINPESRGEVQPDTAVAWNPTLSGVKSEDTFLLSRSGLVPLTRSDSWPLIRLQRDDNTLELADWLILPTSS
ncbi:M24 family metallopeptidase [Pantoea dispersa]|uniref:M24 family metallopeptidase n=1 Tax=Pantoea dispersa TaxID=59814 RepID=UPI002DB5A9E5|nr:M24 family metallopeptidase [Pantoea dispersa]MEB5836916.1 M24 family metallopeptidase [Pantoea dispersa]